jgi:hypothetical protein
VSQTTRKLEVFSLVVSIDGNRSVDYERLFRLIGSARVTPEERDGAVVAMPTFDRLPGQLLWLVAYEGPVGMWPLIFDRQRARARLQRLGDTEIVATKTHGLVDIPRKEAIIEYNQRGAKATDIARILTAAGRSVSDDDTLQIDLNPVADVEFVHALDRFERIRVASLKVARPNPGWSDHYEELKDIAEESRAATVSVEVTASRGRSLSTGGGVVKFIKELSGSVRSILKGAKVTGTRQNESEETTVSLAHHIEHQRVPVRLGDEGHVDEEDMKRRIKKFRDERARGHR